MALNLSWTVWSCRLPDAESVTGTNVEMNRLLEMGLISDEDFARLMATGGNLDTGRRPLRNVALGGHQPRPTDTQLPKGQVLAILSQHAETTKHNEWTNNIQEAVRGVISAILDQEKYSSLPDMQRQIEAALHVDMRPHLDWLQDTIFQQSKQKLKRINDAAELIRVGTATTRVQRTFRARRWALRRRARLRQEQTRLAADRVARQAIERYALDVVGRCVGRYVFVRRFRRYVVKLQREAAWQHGVDILRRNVAQHHVARWIRESWPRYRRAQETWLRRMALESSVATMAQALVRGFLVRRHHLRQHESARRIQNQVRLHHQILAQRIAATRLQMWTRQRMVIIRMHAHLRQRTAAAKCIQAMYTRWRHKCRQRNAAAVVEVWRSNHLAVRKAKEVAARLRWQRMQVASCRTIQRRFRCALARLNKRRLAAAHCIQRNIRRHHARVLRRQAAGLRIVRYVWAWRARRDLFVRRLLEIVRQKCCARKWAMQTRRNDATDVLAAVVHRWVARSRQAKQAAATTLGRWMRRYLARKRDLLERRRRSSGRVPIRPPAKKPYSVSAATIKPTDPVQLLPPVRLVKRFDRMCKTCHRHAHPHACEGIHASSPVKKMVAVRAFGGRVTRATALRAHELLLLGNKPPNRRLQSQPPFVAKPPAFTEMTKPSLRKSLSIVHGLPKSSNQST
ncbi:hypothetical protein, variant [Aphanomyces invadans]|uniref:Uncharacterized protein n=1 Tax=Aphanomyces invadans TaxID=157072 RepID=A0A024UVR2_9STRA|nr:hypothetical protein, variant [Aphanomyces invadans]ETW10404.1 hypothetical protein, variant [Aphanomyces invadans]|eukprot:XP_008861815.1 hypothetical protein, variant [Aphanomyces invadans]